MNKKVLGVLIIIAVGVVLLIFRGDANDEAPLPTRDVEGVEPITNVEEYCQKITDLQEFDDSILAQEYYQDCLLLN